MIGLKELFAERKVLIKFSSMAEKQELNYILFGEGFGLCLDFGNKLTKSVSIDKIAISSFTQFINQFI